MAIDPNARQAALDAFTAREGHALVPANHVETYGGEEINLGSWVSYLRTRYRQGQLAQDRIANLEAYSGWQWGPLRPGPKSDTVRDNHIKQMRSNGMSLREIGQEFGLSRQRIHQIVSDV